MDPVLIPLLAEPRVAHAARLCRDDDELTLGWQMELAAIPAPPFGERERARRMAGLLERVGLQGVHSDPEGNVVGALPGSRDEPPLVLSAHLDTVFPPETAIAVHRDGDLLTGPGISDDARGLAVLLAVVRALVEAGVPLTRPLLVVATVGEEGLGDLRGARHLVGPRGAGRDAAGFVSVDGAGLDRIVVRGVGSRRFRVKVKGPGGHSWIDWGLANPIHALGATVAELTALPLPEDPPTSLTVARWGGGTSINAIPQEAWLEIDARSTAEKELEMLEGRIRSVVERCVLEESAGSRGGALEVELTRVGHRPAGATDPGAPLVQAALAATRAVGAEPLLTESSTDANAAMAAGIPAVTVGGGGEAGLAHTSGEWYRNQRGADGVLRALYTVLLGCGVEN